MILKDFRERRATIDSHYEEMDWKRKAEVARLRRRKRVQTFHQKHLETDVRSKGGDKKVNFKGVEEKFDRETKYREAKSRAAQMQKEASTRKSDSCLDRYHSKQYQGISLQRSSSIDVLFYS